MCIVTIYILILTVPNGFLGLLTLTSPQHDLFCVRSFFNDSVSTMNQFINFDRLEQSRIQLAFDITDVFPILSNMYIFKLNLADSVIALAFFFFEVQSQTREKKTMGSNLTLDPELDYTMCSEEKPNCRPVNGLQSNP